MEIKLNFLINKKDELEIEFEGGDETIPQLLVSELINNKDIENITFKREHPLVAHPKLYIKTKNKDAKKLLISALEAIKKDFEGIKI